MPVLEIKDLTREIKIVSDVPLYVTESEFAPHREVRARVIALIRSHGVTLVEVIWA